MMGKCSNRARIIDFEMSFDVNMQPCMSNRTSRKCLSKENHVRQYIIMCCLAMSQMRARSPYTYHGSSATSQTSQISGLAPSELEQEFELNLEDAQKYTIPSLLACGSKSSSPAISQAAGSDWTANDTSAMQTDFINTRHYSHDHHLQANSATVMVNTSDIDLSKISTELDGLSQASERMAIASDHQDVLFVFPVSSR